MLPDARKISKALKKRILDRDGHKCLRCGDTDNLTIDHIKPVIFGGTRSEYNLQTLCFSCNQAKGRKTMDYRQVKINVTGFIKLESKKLTPLQQLKLERQKNKDLKARNKYLKHQIHKVPKIIRWLFNINYEEENQNSANEE